MSPFFLVTLADGRELREPSVVWNDVPDGIVRLALLKDDGRAGVEISAAPGRRCFAVNEGVAVKGERGMLSAKILGLEEDGICTEWRLDLITDSGVPQLTRRAYPVAEIEFPTALRRMAAAAA